MAMSVGLFHSHSILISVLSKFLVLFILFFPSFFIIIKFSSCFCLIFSSPRFSLLVAYNVYFYSSFVLPKLDFMSFCSYSFFLMMFTRQEVCTLLTLKINLCVQWPYKSWRRMLCVFYDAFTSYCVVTKCWNAPLHFIMFDSLYQHR